MVDISSGGIILTLILSVFFLGLTIYNFKKKISWIKKSLFIGLIIGLLTSPLRIMLWISEIENTKLTLGMFLGGATYTLYNIILYLSLTLVIFGLIYLRSIGLWKSKLGKILGGLGFLIGLIQVISYFSRFILGSMVPRFLYNILYQIPIALFLEFLPSFSWGFIREYQIIAIPLLYLVLGFLIGFGIDRIKSKEDNTTLS